MKRGVLVVLAVCFYFVAWGQTIQHIQDKVADLEIAGVPFIMQAPMKAEVPLTQADGLTVSEGQYLSIRPGGLQEWMSSGAKAIRFEIPVQGEDPVRLKLVEFDLLTNDFQVSVSSLAGQQVDYRPGRYYHGIVEGKPGSVAAISVFDNLVMGVIETEEEGNMILGPVKGDDAGRYIFYNAADFQEELPFTCGTNELGNPTNSSPPVGGIAESGAQTINCVRAYLECEYDMYLEKGSVANVVNHMTGLFNVVALLYANDNMSTTVSEIFVWDTPDGYATSSTGAALNSFRAYRTNFNGDVAHLVSRGAPTGGGVAWVDALCSSYAYAYSYIYSGYNQFPTYSWSVNVIAHEMGHNVGAWHTHDCAWVVNNTPNQAIDGCGDAAGYPGNGNCPVGPVPNSGTLMSYCHLVGGVGIDFNEGFHPIVASVMQGEIDGANCLAPCGNCNLAVSIASSNVSCNGGNNGSATANPTGGTPPYSYSWSNGLQTQTVNNLTAGNYSVTVTDSDNCSDVKSVVINQPAALNLSTVVTNETLPGAGNGSINLTVGGGTPSYGYLWSNGATTQDIFGLSAGTYTVTVTDNNACQAITTAVVSAGGCNMTVSNFPYSEGFEGGFGDWTQDVNDNINWTRNSGNTPSSGTGPSSAYEGSFYLYTEASGNPNSSAGLTSPCLDLSGMNDAELTFAYHMYGVDMGTLSVRVSTDNGSTWSTLWSLSGNQGSSWYTHTISLAGYITAHTKIKFYGTTGPNFRSDIAIDDISIAEVTPPCTPPNLTMAGTNISCHGGNNGTASVTASGGAGPYSYLWSNGGTTSQITGLTAGSYTVTVTDAAGCSATGNQSITEPAAIALSFVVTNETFPGAANGAINMSVAGGTSPYTYLWSNGATTEDISGLSAGTYYVMVTDNNGCTANGNATVSVTACDVVINSYPYEMGLETGFGDWEQDDMDNIDWTRRSGSTPSSGTGPSSAFEGAYYMYTEASGYPNSTAILESPCFDLTSLNDPEIHFAYHMYGSNMGTLSVQVSTNNGNNWGTIWTVSGDQGNQWYEATLPLSLYQTGATKLRFVGLTGPGFRSDIAVDDIIVNGNAAPCNAPVVTLSKSDVTCPGGANGTASASVTGGTAPYSYNWSNGQTTANISGLSAGTYTVTVTDGQNCPATESIAVGEPAAYQLSFAVTNETFAGAHDGAVDLSVSGATAPYSYLWSNGATSQDISGLAAGTYAVTVTDQNGCTGTGSATVNVQPQCTPLAGFPYFESFENGLGSWVQDPGDNFDWTRRSGSTPSSGTGPSGAYDGNWYIYTEATGQFGTAIIEAPCVDLTGTSQPELSFAYHMYGLNMGTLELEISTDGGATWNAYWSRTGNQGNAWLVHQSDLSAYIGQAVKFRFLGTIGNGFRSDMAIDAFGIAESATTPANGPSGSVANRGWEIDQVYPNPAVDMLNVVLNGQTEEQVYWQITDMLGRILKKGRSELTEGNPGIGVNVSDLLDGLYLINIVQAKESRSANFVIQH